MTLRPRLTLLTTLALAGCQGASPDLDARRGDVATLRRLFPAQSAAVLAPRASFTPSADGFVVARADEARDLAASLPRDGAGSLRLEAPGGFSVRVREIGARGAGERVEGALTYRRAGGTSWWTAAPGGVEEWLLLEPEAVRRGEPVAAWEIEGGRAREIAGLVEIDDDAGVPRVRITAPAGYAAGGRAIGVRLAARGSRVELSVDADHEAVFVDPVWTAAASMSVARTNHTATLLPSGKVLVAGGAATPSAELYDPALNVWASTAAMNVARTKHTATLLGNGTVLVAGGAAAASAEVYDPTTNAWGVPGPMTVARSQHTATLLPAGTVLLTGGAGALASAEIYDPGTKQFTATASLAVGRYDHAAVRLGTGRVLVLGGRGSANLSLSSSELFDPITRTWTSAGSLTDPRSLAAVVLLPNGKAMAAGGSNFTTPSSGVALKTVELFDPATAAWSPAASMVRARSAAAMALLGSGDVLITGNFGPFGNTVERYYPATNTWSAASNTTASRSSHTATLLADDTRVLLAGGAGPVATAELFTPLALGAACGLVADCGSGVCADGVCCNTSCTGTCVACTAAKKVIGADGFCGPIGLGFDPDNECTDLGAASCGTDGACDGNGGCHRYAAATVCAAGVCAGTTLTLPKECDGLGACVSLGTTDCAPALCAAGACTTSCAADGECAAGAYCGAGGVCRFQLPLGAPATQPNQCASGAVADGVCCDTACAGTCVACTAAKKGSGADGTCGLIGPGFDPDNECAATAPATCGTSGACDGNGACALHPAGTSCGAAGSCAGTVRTPPSRCDGAGTCVIGVPADCAPDLCAGGFCTSGCMVDTDCAPSAYCFNGKCLAQRPLGAPATAGNQCLSGFAADGVCCDAACSGACSACTTAKKGSGADGACGPIIAGKDPDNECATQSPSSCGTSGACDGSGACAVYPAGLLCKAGGCQGTKLVPPALCDGKGTCVPGAPKDCSPNLCVAGACQSSCTIDKDCTPTAYCDATGNCAAKQPIGAPAASGNQCLSTFAADGVCCDAACAGPCEACVAAKNGGLDGVCGPVPQGSDPDDECIDQGDITCGTNGTCSGQGACDLYAKGTLCAPASCQGSKAILADLCDGKGTCVDSGAADCGSVLCQNGVCPTKCAVDTDCAGATAYCDSVGVCQPKKGLGLAAASGHECLSSFAADGVCCDMACQFGPCAACSIAAGAQKDGVCTALDGATCDDGDACTTVDTCQAKKCVGASPKACPSMDQCHLDGACDPLSGACVPVEKPAKTPCDDGNECTVGDACLAGACAGLSALDYTPCTGGRCFAGKCTLDLGGGGAASSGGVGGATGGGGGADADAGTVGAGGKGSSNGDGGAASRASDAPALVGSGCLSVSGGHATSRGALAALALASLAALHRRRRRAHPRG